MREQEERPFIAWDGEGINRWLMDNITFQDYAMLSNSNGERMIAPRGESLERVKVFQWMIDSQKANPNAINVVFGGNYDFNMILRGNQPPTAEHMLKLHEKEEMHAGSFRVKIMWGRMMEVKQHETRFVIYDVMPFFQSTFVKACDSYLGKNWPGRDIIIKMKEERNVFEYDEMVRVNEYNDYELESLVLLCEELRTRLYAVDLRITKWYGPGAIASHIYGKRKIKECMDQERSISDEAFGHAVRSAYAGGRFEVIKTGYNVEGEAYEYDINSAYPRAMLELPNLATGHWTRDTKVTNFGVYRIRYSAPFHQWDTPFPLYHRTQQRLIFYPNFADGWYWTPEVRALEEWVDVNGGHFEIVDGYSFHDDGSRPFAFVQGMYDERLRLKKAGSGANVGLKLGLNSLYGKMAQQVGWTDENLPPFHQLEWAGYVTSHCRATLMRAVVRDLDSVIAFATDAVFTTRPLRNIPIGEGLGEWEKITFKNLSMLQSGIYYGTTTEDAILRTRGIRPADFDIEMVENGLRVGENELQVDSRRFIGLSASLQRDADLWCCWVDMKSRVHLLLSGESKRMHARPHPDGEPGQHFLMCSACDPDQDHYPEGMWHQSFVPPIPMVESTEHHVEWIHRDDPAPEISEERENEYLIMEYEG